MKEWPDKLERKIAIGIPVLIRETGEWIYFGKYTRWLEWRSDLDRYRTVWTKLGWEQDGTPPPNKQNPQVNRIGNKIIYKIEDEPK